MLHTRRTTFTAVTALALALIVSGPAAAFDLTGSWQGSWTCTGTEAGAKYKDFNKESTLVVTSFGNETFAAHADGFLKYRGTEIADAKKPDKGEISFAFCANGNDPSTVTGINYFEAGRFKVSTKGEKGTISGVTIYSFSPTQIATCKYKYKRVDTTNPNLTYTCP